MSRRAPRYLRALVLASWPVWSAWAQVPAAAAPTPDLEAAVVQALAAHPQIRQAESGVRAADHNLDAARWGWWPSVQVQAATGQRYRESALVVDQSLWNGGRTLAAIDAAQARGDVATLSVAQSAQDLAERTAQAYLAWVAAQDRLQRLEDYQRELERLTGVIERRSRSGVAAPADVEQARVRAEQARASVQAGRGALSSARAALEGLTLQPLGSDTPSWPELQALPADEAWMRCEARHPALTVARAERVALGHEADERSAQLWPRLNLRYQEPLQRQAGTVYPPRWQLMLQAQTDGAAVARSQSRADAERLRAAVEHEQALRVQLQAQVRQASVEAESGRQQQATAERAADQSAELVASATRQFEAGRRTWLDLLNAVREAHDARLNALAARQTQVLATARQLALAQTLPGLEGFNRSVNERVQTGSGLPAAAASAP